MPSPVTKPRLLQDRSQPSSSPLRPMPRPSISASASGSTSGARRSVTARSARSTVAARGSPSFTSTQARNAPLPSLSSNGSVDVAAQLAHVGARQVA